MAVSIPVRSSNDLHTTPLSLCAMQTHNCAFLFLIVQLALVVYICMYVCMYVCMSITVNVGHLNCL